MRALGIILLTILSPLWAVLYVLSFLGILATMVFDFLYEPIYSIAGKPLDKNN